MANGKFSQQLQIGSQGIPSRTERRRREFQLRATNKKQQDEFDALQQKANQLSETEFSNITTAAQYKSKYNSLSPELQQFFISPTEVEQKIQESRDPELQAQITKVEERRSELRAMLDNYTKELQASQKRRAAAPEGKSGAAIRDREDAFQRNIDKTKLPFANEYDELGRKENILMDSGSSSEASQRLSLYERQQTQALINSQEQQKAAETNRILKQAEKSGSSFLKIEESKNGVPQGRKIFAVSPEGDYKLVSESKAQKISGLSRSQIPKAKITEVIKIGDTKITFEGIQDLYKTPQGKLATAYGSLGVSEDELIKSQEEQRRIEAEKYLNEQKFNPVINDKEKPKSVLSKIVDFGKELYLASPFGITSAYEDEGNVKRSYLGNSGSLIGGNFPLTLDYETAKELVEKRNDEENIAIQQVTAIEDLNKIVEQAPEGLKYDLQKVGLEKLKSLGVDYTVDETTGELVFTSKEFQSKKSFAGIEWEKSTGLKKIGVGITIVAIKGGEFYLGGEIIGGAYVGVKGGLAALKGIVGIEKGLQITDVSLRGGKVVGTAEYVEKTPLLKRLSDFETKIGISGGIGQRFAGKGILKTVGKGTVYTGLGGLYAVGKYSQYGNYKDIYGDKTGKELFLLETTGELAGIGTLLGKNFLKNQGIKKLNEQINIENYKKDIKIQHLENIKNFGQFSSKARVEFKEVGLGKTVLTKGEKEILQGIYVRQGGVSPAEARKLIREGAIFEQNLIVESPAGFETFTSSRYGILSSARSNEGFREIGVDFTRKRGRISNVILKSTTGTGKYSLTSVFEKTRRSKALKEILQFEDLNFIKETPSKEQFKLKDVIVSKVGKQGQAKIGSVKISVADIESRLVKSLPKSKERSTFGEAIDVGLPKYNEEDLKDIFKRAGISARTSPKPAKILRLESGRYKGILTDQEAGEFVFVQAGGSGRQRSLKNIFKDLDFKDLERALTSRRAKKTSFSKTFGEEVMAEGDFRREVLKDLTRKKGKKNIIFSPEEDLPSMVGGKGLKLYGTKEILEFRALTREEIEFLNAAGGGSPKNKGRVLPDFNISPTINTGFKFNTNVRSITPLKEFESPTLKTSISIRNAIKELLGVKSVNQLRQPTKSRLRTNQDLRNRVLQQEILKQESRTRQRQIPQQRSRTDVRLQRIPFVPEITENPIVRIRPEKIIAGFGKDQKKLKKIIKLKKLLQQDELAYFPSFTAKALDLAPIEISSKKEAINLIKEIRTGLEVGRGVRFKK